jgi:hypothetical protein
MIHELIKHHNFSSFYSKGIDSLLQNHLVPEPKLYPRTFSMMVKPGVFLSSLHGIVLGFWGCLVVKNQFPESMTSGSRG